MTVKHSVFLFFLLLVIGVQAQQFEWSDEPVSVAQKVEEGTVTIYQDPMLDTLLSKHILMNHKQNGMPGYRIQIYTGIGRNARGKTYETRADFITNFPNMSTYITYEEPYFKLRVGDFRDKYEAIKIFKAILRKYPNAYLVPDVISFPNLDE